MATSLTKPGLAKPAPKTLGKAAAKPALAPKGKGAAKAETKPKEPKYTDGQSVEFLGYKQPNDAPLFEVGARLAIVSQAKGKDGATILTCVAESDYNAYVSNPEDENIMAEELTADEVKKAEKLVVNPEHFEITHVGRLDELLEENNGDPLEAYTSLQGSVEESFFYMGGFATLLYKDGKFREYGDYQDDVVDGKVKSLSGWGKFAKEMLGMDGRKASAAIQVYRQFSAIPNFDPATIGKVGWVKLQVMSNTVNENNVDELLEKAEATPVAEFRSMIKTDYVTDRESNGTARTAGSGAVKIKRTKFTFALFEDQAEGVVIAFEALKKQFGFNDDQLFEACVMTFARDNLAETVVSKARNAQRNAIKRLAKAGVDKDTIASRQEDSHRIDALLAGPDEPQEAAA